MNKAQSINTLATQIKLRSKCLWVVFCIFISGCSILPTEQNTDLKHYDWPTTQAQLNAIKKWSLFGKLGFRNDEESITAAINKWQQNGEIFEIDISSTFFGLGSSRLSGSAHYLMIEQSGEDPVSSFEPDALIEAALGIPLPVSNLQYWIKGLPVDGMPFQQSFNEQGLVSSLKQDNWSLTYSHYHTDYSAPLPGKIKIQRDNIRIIVAVKEWTLH